MQTATHTRTVDQQLALSIVRAKVHKADRARCEALALVETLKKQGEPAHGPLMILANALQRELSTRYERLFSEFCAL